jgi:hypothetical protein
VGPGWKTFREGVPQEEHDDDDERKKAEDHWRKPMSTIKSSVHGSNRNATNVS